MAHHHGSDMPTSPRAVLHHTDAFLCTILHTTVYHAYHFAPKAYVRTPIVLIEIANRMIYIK